MTVQLDFLLLKMFNKYIEKTKQIKKTPGSVNINTIYTPKSRKL